MFRLLREKRNNIKYSKVQNVTGIQADCDNGCMSDDQVFAELIKKIQTDLQKMKLPKLKNVRRAITEGYTYNKDDGYEERYMKERSNDIVVAFRTDSEEEMRYHILEKEASSYGFKYELDNRSRLERKWHYLTHNYHEDTGKWDENKYFRWKYDLNYDGRKYSFEEEIKKESIVFPKDRLDAIIMNRTDLMNRWFNKPRWAFDRERMEFIEISNEPEHD